MAIYIYIVYVRNGRRDSLKSTPISLTFEIMAMFDIFLLMLRASQRFTFCVGCFGEHTTGLHMRLAVAHLLIVVDIRSVAGKGMSTPIDRKKLCICSDHRERATKKRRSTRV